MPSHSKHPISSVTRRSSSALKAVTIPATAVDTGQHRDELDTGDVPCDSQQFEVVETVSGDALKPHPTRPKGPDLQTRSTRSRCPHELQRHAPVAGVANPRMNMYAFERIAKQGIPRVLACCAMLALAGCAIVKPVWYQTRPDDSDQTVVIKLIGSAWIESLDGKRLAEPIETWNGGWAAVREIRILPGPHTVSGMVSFNNIRAPYRFQQTFVQGEYEISAETVGYDARPQLKRAENQP